MTKFNRVALAVAAGLALVAGQATAGATAAPRVADRVGAQSEDGSSFSGVSLPVLLIGAAVLVGLVAVASDDDSESD